MIEICPAILTFDVNIFKKQIEEYTKLFKIVDIDINISGDFFQGNPTVGIDEVIDIVKDYTNEFDIHLMVNEPKEFTDKFLSNNLTENFLFYIHQESVFTELVENEKYANLKIGIAIKFDSDLREIDFYNHFNNIQVMTVEEGEQGGEFKIEGLKKVNQLREMGYKGIIKIDGGINLETAAIIKNYDINKVSVGSYFAKAEDIENAKVELQKALDAT